MSGLRQLQQEFFGYLLDPQQTAIAERVVSTEQRPAQRRLYYYANAYRLRLKEALATDYERLHAYLGDALFDRLTDAYIELYPSNRASLRDYGRHMVDLVKTLEPFNQLQEVIEIVRIEQAFNLSFDSADRPPRVWQDFTEIELQSWPELKLEFHDSVQLVTQSFNSFQIWQALAQEQAPPQKTVDKSTWVVWRKDLVSRFRSLDRVEIVALETALSGESFAGVCAALLPLSGEQTAQSALACIQQWVNDEMVVNLGCQAK